MAESPSFSTVLKFCMPFQDLIFPLNNIVKLSNFNENNGWFSWVKELNPFECCPSALIMKTATVIDHQSFPRRQRSVTSMAAHWERAQTHTYMYWSSRLPKGSLAHGVPLSGLGLGDSAFDDMTETMFHTWKKNPFTSAPFPTSQSVKWTLLNINVFHNIEKLLSLLSGSYHWLS